MATGLNGFDQFLREGLEQPGAFNPTPYYSPDADVLFFYTRDVPSYAKRLNSLISLVLATDDDSLVGIKVKSVRRIMQKLSQLQVHVTDSKIKLRVLLTIATASPPEDPELGRYEHEVEQRFGDLEIDRGQLVAV